MRRTLSILAATLAVAALPAAAAAQAPAPQQLTAGQPLPEAEQAYVQALTGRAGATTVPKGWTVVAWNAPVAAGTSFEATTRCPAGTVVADLENGLPSAPSTVALTPSFFVPFYGASSFTVTVAPLTAGQAGTFELSAVCQPQVRIRSVRVTGRSPVTFPKTEYANGLRQGAPIPRAWRLYKSVTTGPISPDGAVGVTGHPCPRGTQTFSDPVFRPRAKGEVLPSNGFTLAPGAVKGPLTAYTLCSTFVP